MRSSACEEVSAFHKSSSLTNRLRRRQAILLHSAGQWSTRLLTQSTRKWHCCSRGWVPSSVKCVKASSNLFWYDPATKIEQ
ncbi:hypothetical protein CERZMDRAFT_91619 [Cercospora zeae-maydis SCOH1-5]|uniref:Uncharacterized protein n=1 Tax=Cercospora zeae-maydis SCOH1-5 TaxID=717836 RepID=A0A6A6F6F8_9PEZI|nr:hypothetical protein CERZMDRAFT_91619 [Cercospora zeae-maydis SCOH1-5]